MGSLFGSSPIYTTHKQIAAEVNIKSFYASSQNLQALISNNLLIFKGFNDYGQCGDNTTNTHTSFIMLNSTGTWNSSIEIEKMLGYEEFFGFKTTDKRLFFSGKNSFRMSPASSGHLLVKYQWTQPNIDPSLILVEDVAIEDSSLYVLTTSQMLFASGNMNTNPNGLGDPANTWHVDGLMTTIATNLTLLSSSPIVKLATSYSKSVFLLSQEGRLFSTNVPFYYSYSPCQFCEFYHPQYESLKGEITGIRTSLESIVLQTFNGSSYHYRQFESTYFPDVIAKEFSFIPNIIDAISYSVGGVYIKGKF
eukprot:CAMPEP_0117419776 /NCGR_PEP_ID=MMETSP0758-20121206/1266_1 /TAXON_ID=63605 /ORGANISM="Percolomonas cosmopolitus, Strain AE-1 (ATCC 50343)" /LENGTH=306 /DNA_ID=CAMNT_0005201035 /DNA_START=1760 /DNA_END=2680 /DNA_ORIENTATION=-